MEVKRMYYENGQLKYEEPYENGEQHGLWREYYENGQLKYEYQYENGEPLSEQVKKYKSKM